MSNALRKLRLKFDGIHKLVYGKEGDLELLKVITNSDLFKSRKGLKRLHKKNIK